MNPGQFRRRSPATPGATPLRPGSGSEVRVFAVDRPNAYRVVRRYTGLLAITGHGVTPAVVRNDGAGLYWASRHSSFSLRLRPGNWRAQRILGTEGFACVEWDALLFFFGVMEPVPKGVYDESTRQIPRHPPPVQSVTHLSGTGHRNVALFRCLTRASARIRHPGSPSSTGIMSR